MVNFYRRFLPKCADLMLPLTNMLSGPKGPLELTGEALTAFERIKNSLADATLLTHPAPEAQLSLMVDASNVAVGAVLQQHLTGSVAVRVSSPSAFVTLPSCPPHTPCRYAAGTRECSKPINAVPTLIGWRRGDNEGRTYALREHPEVGHRQQLAWGTLAATAYRALVYALPQAVKVVQLKPSSLTFNWESLSCRPHYLRQIAFFGFWIAEFVGFFASPPVFRTLTLSLLHGDSVAAYLHYI
nr:unnamed protein product [Spirometra erinaceieuropaei]